MEPEEYARMFELEDHYWWFRGRRALVLRLLRHYRIWCAGDRILDVGCGTGATLAALSAVAAPVGLDTSMTALRFCRSRDPLPLVEARSIEIPFRDGSFHAVLALDLMEHVEDDGGTLRELERVCRPGGIVLITVPAFGFLWSEHDEALHHLRRYRARDIRDRMREAGIEVLNLSYVVSFLFLPIALYRLAGRLVGSRGKPETTLKRVPGPVNQLLYWVLRLEAHLVPTLRFPFGVSIVCVGRKAGEGT